MAVDLADVDQLLELALDRIEPLLEPQGRRLAGSEPLLEDGNPLHNMKVFYGTGVQVEKDGRIETRGGVKYTIKQGIVFDAQRLLADVRDMVSAARRVTP